jgi:glucose/arabinose dehydrogenase
MRTRPLLRPATALFLLTLVAPPTLLAEPAAAAPAAEVSITPVVTGLEIPWDVTWVGDLMLFDERAGRLWSMRPGAEPQRVDLPLPPLWNRSEAGLLGIVADPDAAANGYFYTCQSVATAKGKASDVEVWKWQLTSDTTAVKVDTLVRHIPIGSGRHNGCRLVFRSDDMLYIGTGDAAIGRNPQRLASLGGKILRVRSDGTIPKSNPFHSRGGKARYVWNYGHRNVQGLARQPGTGLLFSVEHGTNRDDEINLVSKGRNYGWAPTPGYNESRPMTDRTRFPKAVRALWSSGNPTVATSGATFLSGSQWGDWDGVLAVAMLKGEGVLLFSVDADQRLTLLGEVAGSYGRIRSVAQGPDGALYFTTSNGSGDGVYRLTRG